MLASPQSYPAYGAQMEAGWLGTFWDVHAGMRFGYARDREKRDQKFGYASSGWKSSHDWYNYRVSVGTRLRLSDRNTNRVKPTMGAGITYGWVTRTYHYEHWIVYPGADTDTYSESERKNYHPCFGWLLEMGFQVVPRGRLRYSLLFRFENYDLDVPHGPGHYQEFDGANQISAELGVFYRFPKLSESH
jgi:opacity protein-like surface antigen